MSSSLAINGSSQSSACSEERAPLLNAGTTTDICCDEDSHENWRSVVFCLALDNPFDPNGKGGGVPREVDESQLCGHEALYGEDGKETDPETFLLDEHFLMLPPKRSLSETLSPLRFASSGTFKKEDSTASGGPGAREGTPDEKAVPNPVQKIVELLLRLTARGLTYEPAGMLEKLHPGRVDSKDPCQFHGYRLAKEHFWLSPDEDELYVKLFCERSAITAFAERQSLRFASNPYSVGGGAPFVYTQHRADELAESVELYCDTHQDFFKRRKTHRKKLRLLMELDDDTGKENHTGFQLRAPQKMRLLLRLLREGWRYGGCGIPLIEMRTKGILIRNFFPMHNPAAIKELGISQWASFKNVVSKKYSLFIDDEDLVEYFGERVALYFIWLRTYTIQLLPIALLGVPAAILGANVHNFGGTDPVIDVRSQCGAIAAGVFSIALVCWCSHWNTTWRRKEISFAQRFGQHIEAKQTEVRDEFKPSELVPMTEAEQIYECEFEWPLTLRRGVDGTLWEARSPSRKRLLLRLFVTYPIVVLLTLCMLASIIAVTWWRLEHSANTAIVYGASAITVVISVVFGQLFNLTVNQLNALENNRTAEEEESQFIYKSFFFYFFSSYFAMFALEFWPASWMTQAEDERHRVHQMWAQMLTYTVVLPMVQNGQEIALPYLFTYFRRRRDLVGGSTVNAVLSILSCGLCFKPAEDATESLAANDDNDGDGEIHRSDRRRLWLACSREPYLSPAEDYLEITIQFGYMSMFAAVFPWGPLAALFYNFLEIRIDANKILRFCQRPAAESASTIGPWLNLFWFLTGLSVLNNAYLVTFALRVPRQLNFGTDEGRDWTFCVVQYILVLLAAGVYLLCGGVAEGVHKQEAKEQLLMEASVSGRLYRLMMKRKEGMQQHIK